MQTLTKSESKSFKIAKADKRLKLIISGKSAALHERPGSISTWNPAY